MLREELGFETDDQDSFTYVFQHWSYFLAVHFSVLPLTKGLSSPACRLEEEAALGQHFRESPQLGMTDLFTIEHFSLAMRQFNSKSVTGAPQHLKIWDFIAGGRQSCPGSHRVSDYDEFCHVMRSGATGLPMDSDTEQWRGWMSAFETGMPPHGGASFGVNRMLQGFLGLKEI